MTSEPTLEQNKRAAQQIIDVWDGDDLDALDDILAEDVVLNGHPTEVRGRSRGRDSYKNGLRGQRSAFPDLFMEAKEIIAEDDKVVVFYTMGGTHEGELMGMPPTGNSVEGPGFVIYRFDDGKVVEVTSLPDIFGMSVQLGIVDPPPGA